MPYADYPRMMFHRTQDPVIVQSRDEEDALGADWARTVWPAVAQPPAELFAKMLAPEPAPDAFEPAPRPRKKATRGRAGGSHSRTSEDQHANG